MCISQKSELYVKLRGKTLPDNSFLIFLELVEKAKRQKFFDELSDNEDQKIDLQAKNH